ncbi:hypothetical protein [Cronobacter malonaticus]|uniref:hypothetical protein n=1 Tax=Cronobacter malonaticus TaxID=413503 RepID=UPI0029C9ECE2|nr:hypothetical protein [Cronobacter malonaticus]
MKLIDLLVQELPKRGGWPDGAVECCRHKGSNSIDFYDANGNWPVDCALKYGKDFAAKSEYNENNPRYLVDSVTREQYEAALAAAQQPVWDGEGLPPVGCECEVSVCGGWEPGRIVFSDENIGVAYVCESSLSPTLDCVSGFSALKHFRPIRSEADKRRDEAIAALKKLKPQLVGELAGYLYDEIAAGKIPHIRIE